jgi:type II secretory pathway component PulF
LKLKDISSKQRGRASRAAPRYPQWYVKIAFGALYRRSFYQQLRVFSLAGLPLDESISDLRQQAADAKQWILFQVYDDIRDKLRRGVAFAPSLQTWCPPSEILLIASGKGGSKSMAEAITRVLKMQTGIAEMRVTLFTVMMEPTIILLGTYGLVIWMSTHFVDALLATSRGINAADFTGAAHELVAVGEFGGGFQAVLPPVAAISLGALILFTLPRWTGALRRYADDLPPWSIYRAVQGAGWMQAFSMLAQSGVPYEKILFDTAGLGTPWLRERILAARFLMVRRGLAVGDALAATGFNFPSKAIVLNLKAFGARRGFDEALAEVADEWFKSIVAAVKQSASLMGMLTMVLTTAVILWIFQASNAMTNQMTTLLRSQTGG